MSRRKPEKTDDPFAGLPGSAHDHEIGDASAWQGVGSVELLAAVCAVTARGDAILLGTTSDGGAMSLLIMSRGEKRRFYETEADKMNDLLGLVEEWARNT